MAPPAANGAQPQPKAPSPAAATAPEAAEDAPGEPLRGAAARIVQNMTASLGVPTATSFRAVPAKLLEVNRRIMNGYLGRTRGGKVSFTHIIGYAVVRAIADSMPVMGSTFTTDPAGKPRVVRHEHVNLGLAVDVEKSDGSRTLLVPVIREADTQDFRGFWASYEEVIRRVRSNKLSPDDFAGVNVTLTNPGTIGTVQSVPRLMPSQGVIVGVGAIDYPAEWRGADPVLLAELGASKVVTVTSTYDHRIIQGAESGLFLKRVEELLLGVDGFYDEIFQSLGVPYEAVRWRRDVNPIDHEQTMLEKQMAVATLIRVYRVRGHLIADLDPLRWKEPQMAPELDPATYGLTIWDLDREFLTGGLAGEDKLALSEILRVLRDAYCRTSGVEYMHIQDLDEQHWIQEHVESATAVDLDTEDQRHILGRLNAAEAFEKFLGTKWVGQKRFSLEGGESLIPVLDAILEQAADDGLDGAVMGMSHRGRLNVLANIVGKSYEQIFKDFEGIPDPTAVQGSGDVKYHLGQAGKFHSRAGKEIPVEVAANPSHLEAVDPVVEGMVRARQDQINDPEGFSVLPILMHGDAAFAGQGVVAETLNMSDIKGYRVGGTIHIIVNNQIGFTTTPEAARSGFYASDVGKIVQAPIFHVNGDDPEACVRVARLAYAYRQRFHKDVVDRPRLLPPARAQRGRRSQLHAAADVRQDRRPPVGAQALHRVARQARPHVAGRGGAGARRLPPAAAAGAGRDPPIGPSPGGSQGGGASATGRRPAPCRDRRRPGRARSHLRPHEPLARGLPSPPQARQAVRDPRQAGAGPGRGGLGHRRSAGVRVAAARAHRHPVGRPGFSARHVQPAPRRAGRPDRWS